MPIQYFCCQPANRVLKDEWYILTEDWICQWEYKDKFRRLFVPKGYIYDGGSIPRIAWTLSGLTPDGEGRAAYTAHDVLYRAKGGKKPSEWKGCKLVNENNNKVCCNKREADWVLREFMIFATVDKRKAYRAWRWVSMLGIFFWGHNPPSGNIPT